MPQSPTPSPRQKSTAVRQFFHEKYGQPITDDLIGPDFRLRMEKIKPRGKAKDAVQVQMQQMVAKGLLSDKDFQVFPRWAFDFPGWIGGMDFEKERLKEVMIIQLEPHVEKYDYQVVYELGEATGKREFSINIQTQKIVNRSTRDIWNNAVKMLCTGPEYDSIFKQGNLDALYHILDKLYITDMCHFAPQGAADLLKQLPWTGKYGIRSKVASHFMHQEIKLINPKLLVASGGEVIKAAEQLFNGYQKELVFGPGKLKTNNLQNLPQLFKMTNKNEQFHLLQIPHIGTLILPASSFWRGHVVSLNIALQESGVMA